ncbi:hypothetical protein [Amphritea sp. HPY]|uniref:hypothetical protein n=1 Tax=Amphritea sp. HPY TaxID=3421652 RepID=UPI003D7CF317
MNLFLSKDIEVAPASLSELFMQQLRAHLPTVAKVLSEYGDKTVSEYLQWVCSYCSDTAQPVGDLADVITDYATPLLGPALARQAAVDIVSCPVALTTNHHGVDYFAQSVQGTLLFSLRQAQGPLLKTVPVFACGNIPLDNMTYPRGGLLYGAPGRSDQLTRVPLFSNKVRRQPVARVRGLDQTMLQQAFKRLAKQQQNSEVYPASADTLNELLLQEYAAVDVLQLDNYSDQSVVLNNRIWQRLFTDDVVAPQLIYLELEKIAERLLSIDLNNPQSLVSILLFNGPLRDLLIARLDSVSGCWNNTELQQRWTGRNTPSGGASTGCGTFMFWGVDDKGRRIPLAMVADSDGYLLRGCDDNGVVREVQLTAQALLCELQAGRIMPSVFTCFLVIALARGVTCAGGYYQAEYLPLMQQGVSEVLASQTATRAMAKLVEEVFTDRYMSGMQAVMSATGSGLIPAGPVEIISGGALNSEELQRITRLTLADAHRASLAETMPDALHELLPQGDWQQVLAAENDQLLKDKVVIRQLY